MAAARAEATEARLVSAAMEWEDPTQAATEAATSPARQATVALALARKAPVVTGWRVEAASEALNAVVEAKAPVEADGASGGMPMAVAREVAIRVVPRKGLLEASVDLPSKQWAATWCRAAAMEAAGRLGSRSECREARGSPAPRRRWRQCCKRWYTHHPARLLGTAPRRKSHPSHRRPHRCPTRDVCRVAQTTAGPAAGSSCEVAPMPTLGSATGHERAAYHLHEALAARPAGG